MKRISNDIHEVMKSAKAEIEDFELTSEEKIIVYFSEFPSIAGFPFKIVLIQNQDGSIRSGFRQWDTEYNFNTWKNGVYNLDRLRIITDEVILSASEIKNLERMLFELEQKSLPQNIQDDKALVLDGSDWEFGIDHGNIKVDYQWRAATEGIKLLVPIIEFMKSQYATLNKRH